MVSAAESIAARIRREAALGAVSVRPGLVVSTSWVAGAPVTVIAVDGVNFTNLPISGAISLIPGMTVNVLRLSGQLVVMGSGSTDALPLQGTVSATGTGTCQVQLAYSSGVRTVAASWLVHYTPAVSDVVMISWAYGKPVIVGKLSQPLASTLEPPYVPPLPPPVPQNGTATFTATDSGTKIGPTATWDTGKMVEASPNSPGYSGWWFYGTKIKSTMTGRVANGAPSIYLDVNTAQSGVDLVLHTAANRAGASSGSLVAGTFHIDATDNKRAWFPLPMAWATALINNGGGVSVQPGSSNSSLFGIDTNSQSGAIRIPWKLA